MQYRSHQYVADDWRDYHWVHTGGDYVMAAIVTGVIASILPNR